jgi:catechol 2,3-dioxygenase
MTPATPLSSRLGPAQTTLTDSITYGAVHLDVTDLSRAVRFWGGLIGLQTLTSSADAVRLGVGDAELLVLHAGAKRGVVNGHSGLYHFAIHLPSEAEFARVLLRIAQARYPQAPTDHIMHWANYLSDPDGIGLELAFETPDRFGRYDFTRGFPEVVDSTGQLRDPRAPLDANHMASYLNDRDLSRPLPVGSRIGHVHLHVGDLQGAASFYLDEIGFRRGLFEQPGFGMIDMAAGGIFPHRLAINNWQGPEAPQPPAGTAGLNFYELQTRSKDDYLAARGRLETARSTEPLHDREGVLVCDPAGNRVALSPLES